MLSTLQGNILQRNGDFAAEFDFFSIFLLFYIYMEIYLAFLRTWWYTYSVPLWVVVYPLSAGNFFLP